MPVVKFVRKLDKLSLAELHGELKQATESMENARVHCGHILNMMKARVEVDGGSWWAWFESNVRCISRPEAYRIMEWARAPNPDAAYEAAMAKQREQQKEYREREQERTIKFPNVRETKASRPSWVRPVAPSKPAEDEIQEDLIQLAFEAFDRMNDATRERFARRLKQRFEF
jgi:hypothetical protein